MCRGLRWQRSGGLAIAGPAKRSVGASQSAKNFDLVFS